MSVSILDGSFNYTERPRDDFFVFFLFWLMRNEW